MIIGAIIAEYNPLHNGHNAHIKLLKKTCDAVIIILSGHLVQRGGFAIFDKWTRTKAALTCGADLILEMPSLFSCASAEKFAHGAIKIIKELNCVNILSFGSELGQISKLKELAQICRTIEKSPKMKQLLKQGYSYPKARTLAVNKNYANILKFPNNTLAIEYIKASLNLNLKLKFHTIKRLETTNKIQIANSSFIRNNLNKLETYTPKKLLTIYNNAEEIKLPKKFLFLCLKLKTLENFKNLPDVTEGLENRLFKASKKATNLSEFFQLTKTKRYTMSRLKRIATYALLNLNKNKTPTLPTYTRILGFNQTGRKIASQIKKNKNFLITSNFKKIFNNFNYSATIDTTATDIALTFQKTPKPGGMDFTNKPIIFKN